MKKKEKHTIVPTEEEKNLDELIQVLEANIHAPRGPALHSPDTMFTRGNMVYLLTVAASTTYSRTGFSRTRMAPLESAVLEQGAITGTAEHK